MQILRVSEDRKATGEIDASKYSKIFGKWLSAMLWLLTKRKMQKKQDCFGGVYQPQHKLVKVRIQRVS